MQKTKDRPVHEVRMASVRAAVWRNETASGPRYNVTFSRLYKDRAGEKWNSRDSFSREDLLLVAKVADAAHSWILKQAAEAAKTQTT